MTTFHKICFKILKKPQVLRLKFDYSSLINTIYILSAMLLSCVLSRVVYANNVPPHVPRRNAGSLIDYVRRDIAINFMLTWHKLSFLIGQFEFEV
jgi:fucose 4-O-acetylase-like acetyltransferase